jgi:hypothetical protein
VLLICSSMLDEQMLLFGGGFHLLNPGVSTMIDVGLLLRGDGDDRTDHYHNVSDPVTIIPRTMISPRLDANEQALRGHSPVSTNLFTISTLFVLLVRAVRVDVHHLRRSRVTTVCS